MICLHVALLCGRLRDLDRLARSVLEAFVADLELALREAGTGDASVPRRVRALAEAYHARARAYCACLDRADAALLAEALLRYLWRGDDNRRRQAAQLASWSLAQHDALSVQPGTDLRDGVIHFAPYPPSGGQP